MFSAPLLTAGEAAAATTTAGKQASAKITKARKHVRHVRHVRGGRYVLVYRCFANSPKRHVAHQPAFYRCVYAGSHIRKAKHAKRHIAPVVKHVKHGTQPRV
jgi:hypothetical protein